MRRGLTHFRLCTVNPGEHPVQFIIEKARMTIPSGVNVRVLLLYGTEPQVLHVFLALGWSPENDYFLQPL